jgi:hypothetical protein
VRVYLAAAAFHNQGWSILKDHRHRTAQECRKLYGDTVFANALKFAVVRNPVDRYISACRQCEVNANDPEVWAKIAKGIHPHPDVKEDHHIFVTQVDSTHVDGELCCKVFKFEEDLPEGIVRWLTDQGLGHRRFGHEDPAPEGSVKQQLTGDALKFVKDFYACDFEVFGYEA